MSYPPGVVTRTITVGDSLAVESGTDLTVRATLRSSRGLVWIATGERVVSVPEVRESATAGDAVSFAPPVTDQAGWRDLATGALIDVSAPNAHTHTYTIELKTLSDGLPVDIRTIGPFPLPTGDGSPVDADLLITADTVPGLLSVTTAVSKGGGTKNSGQSPRDLRRPVLTVDAMYPTARANDRIIWVDEKGGSAWGVGADGGLRRSTWDVSTLQAEAAADIASFATYTASVFESATKTFAHRGLFFRTASGVLLMDQLHGTTVTLQQSTAASNGAAWSTVITFESGVHPLGPTAIAQDGVTGYLYLAEYSSGSARDHIDILRSTDDGATWTVWKAMPKTDAGAGIRHWHGAQWDPVSKRVYFSAGDGNAAAGIYRVNADGTDIEPVILNSQIALGIPYAARCVGMMFFPTHIAWGTDGSGGRDVVIRMARDQIGVPTPVVEEIATVDNAVWYTQNVRDDGSMWVCCASTEILPGAEIPGDDGVAHLYAVSDNGGKVDEVAAVAMKSSGACSLSPIGDRSGGNTFWLRSHQYREAHAQLSPFQFRARIGYGVVPLVKPRGNRQVTHIQESRNSVLDLAAGETKVFGHTQAGPGLGNTLYILNLGVKVLSGTGTAKVQVWNATTNALLMEVTNPSRRGSVGTSQEWINRYPLPVYTAVNFRVVETGGANPATVSAFVEFGYGN